MYLYFLSLIYLLFTFADMYVQFSHLKNRSITSVFKSIDAVKFVAVELFKLEVMGDGIGVA